VLYSRQELGLVLTGFAEERQTIVAASAAGRLQDVLVGPDQAVKAGDIVATLDDTQWKLEIAEATAELARLRHESEREKAMWALDLEADRRRFAGDVESTWLTSLETRAALAEAQAELRGLEAKLARSRAMNAESLIPTSLLEEDSTACQAQREVVRGQRELLEALTVGHDEARVRLAEFAQSVGVPAQSALPAALTAAIQVQEIRLQIAELAATRCVLRAPKAGVVSEVLRQPGEVVAMGAPVTTLVDRQAETIIAYAPEAQQHSIVPGQHVRVRRSSGGRPVDSVVLSVGPTVQVLPTRTDPHANVPAWGLAVRVRLPGGMEIRPGESFHILF
jgi:multidrug resistance efflux pump